jgi:alanine-glyoxylate transaminase/serine-glyoxylate transaminase/serine-pyruvate transaminase
VWDRYRDEWGSWHPHPVTMPTNLVLALASSLQRILADGSWISRRAALAERLRDGLRKAGFDPVPVAGSEASLVTAMYAEDPPAVQRYLLEQGIMISGGLAPLAGRTFRVGLMGRTATDEMVEKLLDLIGAMPRG